MGTPTVKSDQDLDPVLRHFSAFEGFRGCKFLTPGGYFIAGYQSPNDADLQDCDVINIIPSCAQQGGGGLSGVTIAVVEDEDANEAVVYKVGLATLMKVLRDLDERGADYAVLRAIESPRRGSAVQFVDESDGVPPLREIEKYQEPEDIGRVPVDDARSATDDRAMFVHMIDTLKLPGNENCDFAGAGLTSAPPCPDRRPSATSSATLRVPRRRLLGGEQDRAAPHVPVARHLPRGREGDHPGLRDQVRRELRPGTVRRHEGDRTGAASAKRRVPERHRRRCPP